MCLVAMRKWLFVLGSGGTLLVAGCPDTNQLQGVVSSSVQSFINSVIALFVENAVNAALGA